MQGLIPDGEKGAQVHQEETPAPCPQGDASCAVETECEALERALHEGPLVWETQAWAPLCLSATHCCAQGHRARERPGLDSSQVCLFPLHTVHKPAPWSGGDSRSEVL